MLKQFDVYRNPSSQTKHSLPYFMIVQNDFYEDLPTRVIIPLMRNAHLPLWRHPLVPEVNIEFETFMLCSPMMTNLNNKLIKREDFICNLKSARGEVISAIDALVTNTRSAPASARAGCSVTLTSALHSSLSSLPDAPPRDTSADDASSPSGDSPSLRSCL